MTPGTGVVSDGEGWFKIVTLALFRCLGNKLNFNAAVALGRSLHVCWRA